MSTERDTHFLGFAKLLVDELGHIESIPPGWFWTHAPAEEVYTLIAQRAYDFAVHVLGHQLAADHYRWPALSAQEAIRDGGIPDLTTLPPAAPESAAG